MRSNGYAATGWALFDATGPGYRPLYLKGVFLKDMSSAFACEAIALEQALQEVQSEDFSESYQAGRRRHEPAEGQGHQGRGGESRQVGGAGQDPEEGFRRDLL